ncbi:MAG: hypothetical protein CVV49_05305 [Spirochaetae bacterium HGW-Spirochaetae-5]|nr:MAG: hypothetical protein CVV49_05305 [Spirochaetae bacterium HGW-Spirochaetae-5]
MNFKMLRIFFLAAPFLIYSAFRTMISIFMISDYTMVKFTAVFSVLVIISLIVFQLRMKDKNYFSFAVSGALLFFTSVIFYADQGILKNSVSDAGLSAFIFSRPESVLYVSLLLMALIPPLFGRNPFTYYFAKEIVPEMFWETRLFRVVNIVISYFWAIIFALSLGSQFSNNAVFAHIVPVVLQLLVGVPATKFLIPFLQIKLAFVERGAPRDFLHSAEQALIGMPYVFDKKAAGDLKIVIQFFITGGESIEGYLEIGDGNCSYHNGVHPVPSMTMKSPADIYLKIARNEISGTDAFFRKLIVIEGDFSIALKMEQLFGAGGPQVESDKKAKRNREQKKKIDSDHILIPKNYYSMQPGEVRKVLLIQASPRKAGVSKTDILAQAFLEGCRSAGAETETVHLADKNINSCIGCYTCWTKTPGQCIYNDDAAEIMKKEDEADLVVYASPLYIFGIVSSLKQYFDRRIPRLEPFLVTGESGMTSHPTRAGYKKSKNVAVLGVCGFPEVSHFDSVSAYFHHVSNTAGDNSFNIVAEIYRPASEILNNGFYGNETGRILELAGVAGEQIVRSGTIEKSVIDGIAEVRVDTDVFRDQANKTWELCINEGLTLSQVQERFSGNAGEK